MLAFTPALGAPRAQFAASAQRQFQGETIQRVFVGMVKFPKGI